METVARFNSIFRTANECRHRYRVLLGSAGSGKSVNVAQDFIIKLSDETYKGCSLLVVRGVEVSHLNSTFAELCGAVHRLGLSPVWETRLNPLSMRCTATGNSIIFRGCSDQRAIERLKSVTVPSGKITWVWIEEATELQATDFETIDDRLRGELSDEHYYQLTLTFNPVNANHWIKSRLWDYDSADIFTHRSTYRDNKYIDPEYSRRMERRRELDPEGYRIYGLGEWGETSGLIFQNVTTGDYSGTIYEHYSVGADWGYNHATAVLLIGWRDGEPYILNEVYATGRTTGEIIRLCVAEGIPKKAIMYCDSAEPDRIKEFRAAGYRAEGVSKEPNSISNQIAWLQNRRIYVDVRCMNTVKELQQYRWAKDRVTGQHTDTPIMVNDDCIAALRYGIEPMRKARPLQTMSKGVLSI